MTAYRPTMAQIIAQIRLMIGDPGGTSQFFTDQQIQDVCDQTVDFIRYEGLAIAPTIINTPSTGNQATTIFVEYVSTFQWWEQDMHLQGYDTTRGLAWVTLTASQVDYINGRVWFELPSTEWSAPTVPGQYPPVFATGQVFDVYMSAAKMLEMWAAALAGAYDITVEGQSMRRSQLMTSKLAMAAQYKMQAKPRVMKMRRNDVMPEISSRRYRLLDSDDIVRGA